MLYWDYVNISQYAMIFRKMTFYRIEDQQATFILYLINNILE